MLNTEFMVANVNRERLACRRRTAAVRILAASLSCLVIQASMPALAHNPIQARVVTLAPHITELMFEAGAGEHIVGTVTSSNYPAAANTLPRVGDGLNVNPEALLSLEPTDVLAWQRGGAALVLSPLLTSLNIRLGYIEPRTVDDIPRAIASLGQRFGTTGLASQHARELEKELTDLRQNHAHASPVSLLLEIGQNPPYTLGNDLLTNDALGYCGARNLYQDSPIAAPQIQQEFVLTHPPDMILVASSQPHAAESAQQRWQALGLPAARNGHVYAVDPDAFLRPGPRLVSALVQVCAMVDAVRNEHRSR
jgi:iron complex transport system substrate-binding protein/vitamin B12 transport system substrate-binding protein